MRILVRCFSTLHVTFNSDNLPQFKTSLWKMNTETNALQHIVELKGHIGDIKGYEVPRTTSVT